MAAFSLDGFGTVRSVRVDVVTDRYRVSGTIHTRFGRVAEILNQHTATHLPIDDATVHEHGDAPAERAASAIVALDEILLMTAPELNAPRPGGDMRVPRQAVHARLGLGPMWVAGNVHVPVGSRPMDGLLNVADRFIAMTDVTITSAAPPDLTRSVAVAAVRRDRAHVVLFDEPSLGGDRAATESVTRDE